jgi:hypothetical protein
VAGISDDRADASSHNAPWHFGAKVAQIVIAAALVLAVRTFPAAAQQFTDSSSANKNPAQELQIPAGTILPVRLGRGISSRNARPGQIITARIMQDVPLANREKIHEGTKVNGKIVSASANGTQGARIVFRFDVVESHHEEIPIVASLRAMASFMEVLFAETPETTPGFGDPYVWSVTHQIGGDVKYGVGGPVTDQFNNTVGKGTFDGVLVHVRAQAGTNCRGALDQDQLQALWVFSSDACGVYGMDGVRIVHAGRTDPVGEIILATESRKVNLPAGTAMLLRVTGS